MTYASEVSVKYNPYTLFTKEEINRNQFHPADSEENYNETGKGRTLQLINGYRKRTNKELDTVVEIGCGDLRIGRFMAKECKNYIGMDISPFVLEAAQDKAIEYNVDNAKFILSDEFDEGNVADFLYCFQVIQHNPYEMQIEIINKIKKCLKPNGWACIHLPKLENKPDYENCETCMCFSKKQVMELGSYFSVCELDEETLLNDWEDYYLWVKK